MKLKNENALRIGQKVKVYLNLNKSKGKQKSIFSIVDMKTGRVCGYHDRIVLKNAVFHVSENGRQRVLREKQKNVHAWVVGDFAGYDTASDCQIEVYYNPYLTSSFIIHQSHVVITEAPLVVMHDRRAWIAS